MTNSALKAGQRRQEREEQRERTFVITAASSRATSVSVHARPRLRMSTDVTDAELAACADVLRRAAVRPRRRRRSMRGARRPTLPRRRRCSTKLHGEQDVVEFLKEQAGYCTMLGKLERLQKRIDAEHEKRRQQAASSGINKIREAAGGDRAVGEAAAGADVLRIGLSAGDGDEDEAATAVPPSAETSEPPPIGSFRRYCNTCKVPFDDAHHFYHALCPPCADLNWSKRQQSADMAGKICVVTGGRVRIGYETVLKLLRAGAFVVATTRYRPTLRCATRARLTLVVA